MNIIKKFGAGFYLGIVAIILSIVAICMYFSNIANAYFTNIADAATVSCTIIAIILTALFLASDFFLAGKNKVVDIVAGLLPAGASFCLFTAFCKFLNTRVYSMAIVYGSDLENGNTLAHSAMAQAIAALIIFFIAAIALIVASYCTVNRAAKAEKDAAAA